MDSKRDLFSLVGKAVPKKYFEVKNVLKNNRYFNYSKPEVSIARENFPKNTLVYVNQTRKTLLSNMIIYLCDCEILEQIIEVSERLPDNVDYQLKNDEVKYIRIHYNSETGDLLGVYLIIGRLVARGYYRSSFFDYGYDPNNCSLLYSIVKKNILRRFTVKMPERLRESIESSDFDFTMSK